jgi:hypothetical protein
MQSAVGNIGCLGEVMNPAYAVYGDVTGARCWCRVWLHWRALLQPPPPCSCGGRQRPAAFGAKVFHEHVAPGVFACGAGLADLLAALPARPVVLLLHRRSIPDCYLSLCRAFESDRWYDDGDDDDDDDEDNDNTQRPPALTSVGDASADGLEEFAQRERDLWEHVAVELAVAGYTRENSDLVVLCYEDLLGSRTDQCWEPVALTRVARALGVEPTQEWLRRRPPSRVQRRDYVDGKAWLHEDLSADRFRLDLSLVLAEAELQAKRLPRE